MTTPALATIEAAALDLSSALLSARNAAPEGSPAREALATLERQALALYEGIARLRVETEPARPLGHADGPPDGVDAPAVLRHLHEAVESPDPYAVYKWYGALGAGQVDP